MANKPEIPDFRQRAGFRSPAAIAGDLNRAVAALRNLENRKAEYSTLWSVSYSAVCDTAFQLGKYAQTAEYAIKWLSQEKDPVNRQEAAFSLVKAINNSKQMTEKELAGVKSRVAGYVSNHRFAGLALGEQKSWLVVFHLIFDRKYLSLQLELAEAIFRNEPDNDARAHAANSYLLVAKRIKEHEKKEVDREKVREMAEFQLGPARELLLDRRLWDIEIFHTFIMNLAWYGLYDLARRAIDIYQPESDDPVHGYLVLCEKMEEGPEAAFAESIRRRPLDCARDIPEHKTIRAELRYREANILRNYLESRKKSLADCSIDIQTSGWNEIVVAPRSDQPDLLARMQKIRENVFQFYGPFLRAGNFVCHMSDYPKKAPLEGEDRFGQVFILLLPEDRYLQVYLEDKNDQRYIKFLFPLRENCTVSPAAIFDGIPKEEQKKVPLFWEYLLVLLTGTIYDRKESLAAVKSQLKILNAEIDKVARLGLEQSNQAAWEKIEKAIAADARYGLRQDEIESRIFAARKLIELLNLDRRLRSAGMELEKNDPLYGIVDSLALVVAKDAAEQNGEEGKSGGDLLEYKLVGGESLRAEMRGIDRIDFPGLNLQSGSLTRQYLLDLIYGTILKITEGSKKGKKSHPLNGYLIQLENEEKEEEGWQSAGFKNICRSHYLNALHEKGLLWPKWFTREAHGKEDQLFRPLPEQSAEGKKKAMAEVGAEQLFLQLDPIGVIQRLRIGKIGKGNKADIGAYKRNPLREEQQRLMDDPRPLPSYFGLYIITTLSGNKYHARPCGLAASAEQIFAPEIFGKYNQEFEEGRFKLDWPYLLEGTKREQRDKLLSDLQSGKIAIIEQKIEVFDDIQTTYKAPQMATLASMLARGFKLV